MDNTSFRSVPFGGFDKQDVMSYIKKTAKESSELQTRLQQENEQLRQEKAELTEKVEELQDRLETLRVTCEDLQETLAQERSGRRKLEAIASEKEQLAAQAESMRPDAEAYARFRDSIGTIECEARKRAADLEDETKGRMELVVKQFRSQYKTLMNSFASTAAHINSELRKMEVSLTQLPRALDQPTAELEKLTSLLEEKGEKER